MKPIVLGKTKSRGFKAIWSNFHIYLFLVSKSNSSLLRRKGYGVTVRIKRNNQWAHYQLVLFERNSSQSAWRREQKENDKLYQRGKRRTGGRQGQFVVRPSMTIFEFTKWYTRGDGKTRIGLKSYLRLKMCLGGKEKI